MNNELQHLYDLFARLSKEERIQQAKQSANVLFDYLVTERKLKEKEALYFVIATIRLFVSYDRLVTEEECDLFNKVIGTTFSIFEFKEFVGTSNKYEDKINNIIDNFPMDVKDHVCILGLAFISVDGKISESEKEIFEKILL